MTLAQATPGTVFFVDHFRGADDGSAGYSELSTARGRKKVRDDLLCNMEPWIEKGRAFLVELRSDRAIVPLRNILSGIARPT